MSKAALNKRNNARYSNTIEKKEHGNLDVYENSPMETLGSYSGSNSTPGTAKQSNHSFNFSLQPARDSNGCLNRSAFCGPLGDLFCLSCTLPRFGV